VHLAELMEHVRLPLLPQEYLIQRVEPEPLFQSDTKCKNLIYRPNSTVPLSNSLIFLTVGNYH